MSLTKLRCFNLGSIAAGSSAEKEFAPPEDWTVSHIFINDRTGSSLYNTQVYIKVGGDLLTDDFAPARLFHVDNRNLVEIGRTIAKGTSIYVKVTNNETASINPDVCFEVIE